MATAVTSAAAGVDADPPGVAGAEAVAVAGADPDPEAGAVAPGTGVAEGSDLSDPEEAEA